VASSAVLEAMLLAVGGAIVGAASIWLLMDGFLYAAASSVYAVRVDFHLLLVGSCWGLGAHSSQGDQTNAARSAAGGIRNCPWGLLRQ
jgi:hypothetical protein